MGQWDALIEPDIIRTNTPLATAMARRPMVIGSADPSRRCA